VICFGFVTVSTISFISFCYVLCYGTMFFFFVWVVFIAHLLVLVYYCVDVNMPCIGMSAVKSYYVCHFDTCYCINYVGCGLILYVYVILVLTMYNYVSCGLIYMSMSLWYLICIIMSVVIP
jgi:hypothetical protein